MDAAARLTQLLPARQGHFVFESGYHSACWLDLERLLLDPAAIRPLAAELAERMRAHAPDVVCGPLVEGAYVALMVAESLGLPFTYAERFADGPGDALFPISYRLPLPLRAEVHGRRVAIVNDVVSAGSAVRGTHADLLQHDAVPVAIATLAVVGDEAARFAADHELALETLLTLPSTYWAPDACPLCAAGEPFSAS
jgi:orotate phosphoribosyltransferase